MQKHDPVWKILAAVGAIPYLLLILYGLYGAIFGSPFSTLSLPGSVGFCYNVLAIHNLLWPIFLVCLVLLNIGAWGWFLQAYRRDPHPGRILLFLLSIGPMLFTIIGSIFMGSHAGIMYEGLMSTAVWGVPSFIPWAVNSLAESWYFHLAPLVCFPYCVSNRKFE